MHALAPAAAHAAGARLVGRVVYRERLALPRDAVIEVKLVDVSLADAPAKVIARTSRRAGTAPFVSYRLRYDRARIRPGRSYALQARITENGRLIFINTSRRPAFEGDPNAADILVERVRR